MEAPDEPSSASVIRLAESRLTVPPPSDHFAVSARDWRHLRKLLVAVKFRVAWTENVMWMCIPLVPSALVALFLWWPVYDALSEQAKLAYAWISPALALFAGAALLIAIYSGLVKKNENTGGTERVNAIVDFMDEMHSAAVPGDPAEHASKQ